MNQRLFTAIEAAEYLSISRAKLYEWLKKDKIPSITIDSCRLFDVVELDNFIESLKQDQGNV